MRVLVVYCHPVETSFHAALHADVVRHLRRAGHEVDDCDLYAEGFDPVLSRAERLGYHDVPSNQMPLQAHVARLQWARRWCCASRPGASDRRPCSRAGSTAC